MKWRACMSLVQMKDAELALRARGAVERVKPLAGRMIGEGLIKRSREQPPTSWSGRSPSSPATTIFWSRSDADRKSDAADDGRAFVEA
jgi:hypothetical protein